VANEFKPKPLVDVNLTSPFGGIEDLETFKQDGIGQRSYTYVPGFSEMLANYDSDVRRAHQREIKPSEVRTLPVNCRWFRTVKGSGSDPDQMRTAHARNLGYRAATKDDIGQPWMTELPPGAVLAPDGTVKAAGGDVALYVIDREGAARNALRKKRATEAMVDGMEMQMESVAARHRTTATANKTLGTPIGGTK
jgi:hypothetical protein